MSHGVPRVAGEKPITDQDRKREIQRIEDYKSLVDSVNALVRERQYSVETLELTSKLLKWNPEFYTIWNHRRIILQDLLERERQKYSSWRSAEMDLSILIADDLAFLLPLLRKFPKCYWIWNYRLWLLEQTIGYLSTIQAQNFWQQELVLAGKMLSLDSRNFNGWGYRRKVIEALRSFEASEDNSQIVITEQEFEYTTKMITSNLSNFSAWHYRSKLIPTLLDERRADHKTRCEFLDEELELIQRALWTGSDDQSLWFYHQCLMSTFDPRHKENSIAPGLTEEEKAKYLSQEMERVREMLDGAEDCKWVYQALISLDVLCKDLVQCPPVPAEEVKTWVERLVSLDPMRSNRWRELKNALDSCAEPNYRQKFVTYTYLGDDVHVIQVLGRSANDTSGKIICVGGQGSVTKESGTDNGTSWHLNMEEVCSQVEKVGILRPANLAREISDRLNRKTEGALQLIRDQYTMPVKDWRAAAAERIVPIHDALRFLAGLKPADLGIDG